MKKSIEQCLYSLKNHYSAKSINYQSNSIFKFFSGMAVGISLATPMASWPAISIYTISPVVATISTVADQDIVSDHNKTLEAITNKSSKQTNNIQRSNLDVTATNLITSSAEYGAGIAVGYTGANILNRFVLNYI